LNCQSLLCSSPNQQVPCGSQIAANSNARFLLILTLTSLIHLWSESIVIKIFCTYALGNIRLKVRTYTDTYNLHLMAHGGLLLATMAPNDTIV